MDWDRMERDAAKHLLQTVENLTVIANGSLRRAAGWIFSYGTAMSLKLGVRPQSLTDLIFEAQVALEVDRSKK